MSPEEFARLAPGDVVIEIASGKRWRVVTNKRLPGSGSRKNEVTMRLVSPMTRVSREPICYELESGVES